MFKVVLFQGIGDCFYQIPVVRALAAKHGRIAVATAYPELFEHIPGVSFWYRPTMLVSQDKAIEKVPHDKWAPIHKSAEADLRLGYSNRKFSSGLSILEQLNEVTPENTNYDMGFPIRSEWLDAAEKVRAGRKIAVIRRPTVRREYPAVSRNPKPGLIGACVDELNRLGFTTIAVGDIQEPHERGLEDLKVKHNYEGGQLSIPVIAALTTIAEITVTPVGYAVPMTLATKARCFTVFGGHVGPEFIFGPKADMRRVGYVAPHPFCNCFENSHATCNKEISRVELLRGLHSTLALE